MKWVITFDINRLGHLNKFNIPFERTGDPWIALAIFVSWAFFQEQIDYQIKRFDLCPA